MAGRLFISASPAVPGKLPADMIASWLIYGATGFTGELIAEEAKRRGHAPILAGRSAEKLTVLADRLQLPFRAFPLDDPGGLRAGLEGVKLVLHCAGPFVRTSAQMVRACLDVGAHYLDITGELSVFEAIFAQEAAASARGVCLMPGVGFDVVPTDCLAVHVAGLVKHPRRLEIAIAAIGLPSAGTAESVVEMLPGGVQVRRDGKLVSMPPLKGTKEIPFAARSAWAMPAPLADLTTAFHSTGIEDITTYFAIPSGLGKSARTLWPLIAMAEPMTRAMFKNASFRGWLASRARSTNRGPDEAQRQTHRSHLWACASSDTERAEATLETVDGYEFTRLSAVRAVEAVLERSPTGAKTPAQVLGKDFVLELPATERADRPRR